MNLAHIIWPQPGTYVLAVSGGVDSMALFDVLSKFSEEKDYELIVAHFDHKMRKDSGADATFVEAAAKSKRLKFELGKPKLKLSNEADARAARYAFLNQIAADNKADGIITAHHQDDLIETALLNLARGSRRVGLAPFAAVKPLRPFRNTSRAQIQVYARDHAIEWREDITNTDTSNPRNFLRHELIPLASEKWRHEYLGTIDKMGEGNDEIDLALDSKLEGAKTRSGYLFPRADILNLSLDECAELLLATARKLAPGTEMNERLTQEMVIFAKTAKPGRGRPICRNLELRLTKMSVEVVNKS